MKVDRLWKMALACMAAVLVLAGTSSAIDIYSFTDLGPGQVHDISRDGSHVTFTDSGGSNFVYNAAGTQSISIGGLEVKGIDVDSSGDFHVGLRTAGDTSISRSGGGTPTGTRCGPAR